MDIYVINLILAICKGIVSDKIRLVLKQELGKYTTTETAQLPISENPKLMGIKLGHNQSCGPTIESLHKSVNGNS